MSLSPITAVRERIIFLTNEINQNEIDESRDVNQELEGLNTALINTKAQEGFNFVDYTHAKIALSNATTAYQCQILRAEAAAKRLMNDEDFFDSSDDDEVDEGDGDFGTMFSPNFGKEKITPTGANQNVNNSAASVFKQKITTQITTSAASTWGCPS